MNPEVAALVARIRSFRRSADREVDHYNYDALVRDVLAYISKTDLRIPGALATELGKVESPVDWGWYA